MCYTYRKNCNKYSLIYHNILVDIINYNKSNLNKYYNKTFNYYSDKIHDNILNNLYNEYYNDKLYGNYDDKKIIILILYITK